MAANEYYQSAPGPSFNPPNTAGKTDQASPSKDNLEGYFSTEAPHSAFAVSTYVVDPLTPVDDDPLPVPPPRMHNPAKVSSPPAPQGPGSPVTDESDGSVVHIHHTASRPGATHTANASPPPSSHHTQSGTLSLTHSNLGHHDGFDSSDRSPPRGHGPASKRHLRPRELSTHSKDTLIQLLIRQEFQVDDCKKALKNALEKLERYKSDLADANSHCRRVEKLYQKLADERMLMQTQVSDTVGRAQQQTYAAQQELSIFKLKLEHTENALALLKAELREVKLQRDKARSDAERSREDAYRIREEHIAREAREQGRKQGYNEGIKQGHVIGITQTVPPATTGESSTTPIPNNPPAPSNPNTSATSSHSRAQTATSQSDRRSSSSRDPNRASKIDVEDLVQKIRRETEERYQRQFDQQLEQERQRLHIRKLEEDQEREREVAEERERFRLSIEAREQQRSAELEAEIETLRQLERQRSEEVRNEQQKAIILQVERDKEKELKEKEQRERERERQEREHERLEEARRHEQEQRSISMQRQAERTEALQRDRERDRAVTEATAQAARATAQANAAASAASASSSRPKSRASVSSSDTEQNRSYTRNQPYFPMPRPPGGMPMPTLDQSSMVMPEPSVNPGGRSSLRSPQPPVTIPASVSMPEPNFNPSGRSSRSPRPPVTIPASVSMPEPNINPSGRSSRSPRPPVTMPAAISMPEPSINTGGHSYRSPQPPVTVPAAVSMPEPSINTGGHSLRSMVQPNLPSTIPGRHRPRRSSMESQSSISTAGGLDKLVTFPMPGGVVPGRPASATSSGGPGPAFIPPIPEHNSRGGNNNNRPSMSHPRGGGYTRPNAGGGRDALSDIPEDASFRLSPGVRSPFGGHGPVIPGMGMPERPDSSASSRPVIPNIRVEGDDGWRDGYDRGSSSSSSSSRGGRDDDSYLHAPTGQLHRSDSGSSICGIRIEPPSGPGTPSEAGPGGFHHPPPHHNPTSDPNLLSPNHIPAPVLPQQIPPPQPVLPRRAESPALPIRMNVTGGGRGGGGGVPTQPNTPVIPDAQFLPPNFIPQSFTPHTHNAGSPSLPEVGMNHPPPGFIPQSFTPHAGSALLPEVVVNPPPGFIPQLVTDVRTGVTTPLTSVNALPGDDNGGGGGSRRQSIYGNPEERRGTSPYITSSAPLGGGGGGPPVIPTFGDTGDGGSNRGTPRSGMYTPGGSSSRNLPGASTASVYQNPVEGDEEEENNDDLVARNTRINATAPQVTGKQKKKKRR